MRKLLLIPVLFVLTGCDKFLDYDPDLRTDISSAGKMSDLLTSAYPNASYYNMAESRTDNVTNIPEVTTYVNANSAGYLWQDLDEEGQDSPNYYWNATYKSIAAANHVLREINNAKNPGNFNAQKGEALLCRAYGHFMLVQFFAKFYDPATDNSSPGIPYVTEPETTVIKHYERKTVAYVYQMIEKDLLEGLPLLQDNYKKAKFHFTTKAANAFASRFYLYQKRYDKVIEHANKILPANNLAPLLRDLKNGYSPLGSVAYGQRYTSSTENANILLTEQLSWYGRQVGVQHYAMSGTLRETIYDRGMTPRLNAYKTYIGASYVHFVRKFNEIWVTSSINSTSGNGWIIAPLFTAEEVLFNRAEAYAATDQPDLALQDINEFVINRVMDNAYNQSFVIDRNLINAYYYKRPANTAISAEELKEGLFKTCLQFRRMEFTSEGLRWFDILRYKLKVEHITSSGSKITLDVNDPRRVIQLPALVIASGLAPNPR